MKKIIYIFLLFLATSSCVDNSFNSLQQQLIADSSKFVNYAYISQKPLCEIVNVPARTEVSKAFVLANDTKIQIYGVGELLYNFAESRREYFLKGDDIEVYFRIKRAINSPVAEKKSYIFSWENGVEIPRNEEGRKNFVSISASGGVCNGFKNRDSLTQKYVALIKIPLMDIGVKNPYIGQKIEFDIAIGDADDYFVQNNKLGWVSEKDLQLDGNKRLGYIEFTDKIANQSNPEILQSIKASPHNDWGDDPLWGGIKEVELRKDILGTIKNKYDLSAKVKSCWNNDSLYLFVVIQDSQRKRIGADTKRKKRTLADFGWIEDAQHQKVWEMHALDTKQAGGAFKNQKIDTAIHLKRGEYFLKYFSDESHAWNDWDDDPPSSPFYGIIIYPVIPSKKNDKL